MIYNYKDMDVFKLAREATNRVYEIISGGQFSRDCSGITKCQFIIVATIIK